MSVWDNMGITSAWDSMTKQEKIDAFNAQVDSVVIKHGQMLNNRRDLSMEEKIALQTEITENAKNTKAEFAEKIEAESESKETLNESTVENDANMSEENVAENTSENDGNSADGESNGNDAGMGE